MTTFMEGTPFEAKSLKPVDQQAVTPGRSDRRVTRVNVVGDSIIQAQPDTAILTISVVTQAEMRSTRNRKTPLKPMPSSVP